MPGPDLLERIDRIMAELRAVRAEVAASLPAPAAEGSGDDPLIEVCTAVERFGWPSDTLRKWCRENGVGVKRGGRWLVSVPRLQRRLNGSG
jgi:hypothetical protein